MEMPAQGGHDKSSMKQSGHAVSRNDQAQAGHEDASEAKSESCIAQEPNGHDKDHPGRETRVIPCVVVGAHSRTRVCVFFLEGVFENFERTRSNFVIAM